MAIDEQGKVFKLEGVKRIPYIDYFIVSVTIILIALYATIPGFQAFIQQNWLYIKTTFDLLLFFILFIALPIGFYFSKLIIAFLFRIWKIDNPLSIRYGLTLIRINIVVFGFMAIVLSMISSLPLFSPLIMGIVACLLVVFNLAQYKREGFAPLKEDQREYLALREQGEKEVVLIHPYLLLSFPFALILVANYFWNSAFRQSIDSFLTPYIAQNPAFIPLLVITLLLSYFWAFVAFIGLNCHYFYMDHRVKTIMWLKFLWVVGLVFLFTKLVIYNASTQINEPYTTLAITALAGVSGFVIKFIKSKMIKKTT